MAFAWLNPGAVPADSLGMDNVDRVETFLTAHPGRFYCNRCLSEVVSVLTSGPG